MSENVIAVHIRLQLDENDGITVAPDVYTRDAGADHYKDTTGNSADPVAAQPAANDQSNIPESGEGLIDQENTTDPAAQAAGQAQSRAAHAIRAGSKQQRRCGIRPHSRAGIHRGEPGTAFPVPGGDQRGGQGIRPSPITRILTLIPHTITHPGRPPRRLTPPNQRTPLIRLTQLTQLTRPSRLIRQTHRSHRARPACRRSGTGKERPCMAAEHGDQPVCGSDRSGGGPEAAARFQGQLRISGQQPEFL